MIPKKPSMYWNTSIIKGKELIVWMCNLLRLDDIVTSQ